MKLLAIVLSFFLLSSCDDGYKKKSKEKEKGGAPSAEVLSAFMPPNQLDLEDVLEETYQISESDFDKKIAEAKAFFGPLVARHGATLEIVADWADSTVNAAAVQDGKLWKIFMYGGLSRRPEITPDGFAAVIAHEAGHHLAGFPIYSGQSWPAAVEGQSDYGAMAFVRAMWKGEVEKNAAAAKVIPAYPKGKCDAAWAQKADKELCYRIMLAGKSLADLLGKGKAKYETPDRGQVPRTNQNHPQGQCRLDTYMAGAVCVKSFDLGVIPKSEKEAAKYACLKSRKEVGYRPECWFAAKI